MLATVPADGVLDVLVGEELAEIWAGRSVVALLRWGSRTPGVSVDLAVVDPALLEELLLAAWVRRAPAALRRQLPG